MRADRSIPRAWRYAAFVCGLTIATVIAGCQAGRGGSGVRTQSSTARRSRQNPIVRVVCLYDQKPWLNLDAAGDRDPEGIHFRVFLDAIRHGRADASGYDICFWGALGVFWEEDAYALLWNTWPDEYILYRRFRVEE